MDYERVKREKDWHNDTFGKDVRAKTEKFYSVFNLINNELDAQMNESITETTVLLDYGCGRGEFLVKIAPKIKKGVGIDISEELIRYAEIKAEKGNINNLTFSVMDAMNTSFENGYFDIIHGNAIFIIWTLKRALNRSGEY